MRTLSFAALAGAAALCAQASAARAQQPAPTPAPAAQAPAAQAPAAAAPPADGGAANGAAQARGTAPAADRVRVTVRAIAATDGDGGMDARLAPVESHLRSFGQQFRFKSYKLLQEETFDLDWKAPAQMELPGSRSLQVTPRQLASDGKIKVHLELLGEHPAHARKLHTDYSIQRGGTILVGGLQVDPQSPQAGTLLIAVTQAVEK